MLNEKDEFSQDLLYYNELQVDLKKIASDFKQSFLLDSRSAVKNLEVEADILCSMIKKVDNLDDKNVMLWIRNIQEFFVKIRVLQKGADVDYNLERKIESIIKWVIDNKETFKLPIRDFSINDLPDNIKAELPDNFTEFALFNTLHDLGNGNSAFLLPLKKGGFRFYSKNSKILGDLEEKPLNQLKLFLSHLRGQ